MRNNLVDNDRIQRLEYIFHPRSIALVGSTDPGNLMGIGSMFLKPLLDFAFAGEIYPVNLRGGAISGLRVYPTLGDIPGPVDYVISRIPAQFTPQLMKGCAARGVKVISIFAAGFSDSGEEKGKQLEAETVKIAGEGGVRIIGPNCMGIYCPGTRLSFDPAFPKESGPVSFFSQSGGHSWKFVRSGAVRGIRFSKVISYGNACDLNESDFLDYLTHDPETKIITAYIEGVRDGPRFVKALKEATRVKPVIMLKGGRTEAGTRAVAAHTGVAAGDKIAWGSLLEQMGVVQVSSIEEMVDMTLTFLLMPPLDGRRVGLINIGGGESVQSGDDCERAGLVAPPFPPEVHRALLEKFNPGVGGSVRNPMDGPGMMTMSEQYTELVGIISPAVDLVIISITTDIFPSSFFDFNFVKFMLNNLARAGSAMKASKTATKPMAVALTATTSAVDRSRLLKSYERLFVAGLPLYPSIGSAARAISKYIAYHEKRREA